MGSLHVHSDFLLRLGFLSASRAFVKVLTRFRHAHNFPYLSVDARFGDWKRRCYHKAPVQVDLTAQSRLSQKEMFSFTAIDTLTSAEDAYKASNEARCAVCVGRARALFVPCGWCGHGYHIACFRQWFSSGDQNAPQLVVSVIVARCAQSVCKYTTSYPNTILTICTYLLRS